MTDVYCLLRGFRAVFGVTAWSIYMDNSIIFDLVKLLEDIIKNKNLNKTFEAGVSLFAIVLAFRLFCDFIRGTYLACTGRCGGNKAFRRAIRSLRDNPANQPFIPPRNEQLQPDHRPSIHNPEPMPFVPQKNPELFTRLIQVSFRGSILKEILSECPICYVEFKPTDRVIPLPCDPRHYFHYSCIAGWLDKNSSCPLCNSAINSDTVYRYRISDLTHEKMSNYKRNY
eukprot:TRINITY_DN1309_c0_g5_i2.p1 TRINITY_DN1309_c0_g5~~TRINITY_DN1309_c0_g5_i2.p1  ORF type:complete len:227 (-),score=9.61 TRINITY_DN1309_c0_g5_i2:73-753(-)